MDTTDSDCLDTECNDLKLGDSFMLNKGKSSLMRRCLSATCLRPNMSLRRQIFLSFGVVITLTLGIVMLAGISTLSYSSTRVKDMSRDKLQIQVVEKVFTLSRVIAETLTTSLDDMKGFAAILVEVTRDRFMGYPDHPGYLNDSLVPFLDMITERNVYPLKSDSLLPLDWEFLITEKSIRETKESLSNRESWYDVDNVDAGNAVIRFQGACNPNAKNISTRGYFSNCSKANNDVTTGGMVHPTLTFQAIHKKASDFATAILKPIYEYSSSVKTVGLFFVNSGAGAYVAFPAFTINSSTSYEATDCNWLFESNPFAKDRTIGTEEMVNRCHRNGEEVKNAFYNPLERSWCKSQILDPFQIHIYGPYEDAFTPGLILVTVGQAVYDSITKELIACTLIDVSLDELTREIERFKFSESSEVTLIRWDDGTIVTTTRWSSVGSNSINDFHDLEESSIFMDLKSQFITSYPMGFGNEKHNQVLISDNAAYAFHPLPIPPSVYDPDYIPEFAVIIKLEAKEIYADMVNLDKSIDERMSNAVGVTLIAGFVSGLVSLLIILLISFYLTQPLHWMNEVSDQIIQSLGSLSKKFNFERERLSFDMCPKTEVSLLLLQFQRLLKKFSGEGTAKLQLRKEREIQNNFQLDDSLTSLYKKRSGISLNYEDQYDDKKTSDDEAVMILPEKIHFGSLYRSCDNTSTASFQSYQGNIDLNDVRIFSSPLFWWILISIVLPILVATSVISIYVILKTSNELNLFIHVVESTFISMEQKSASILVKARATYSSRAIASVTRDVFLLGRISGWLFFGAIQNSNVMTKMVTAAEQCKSAVSMKDTSACAFLQNRSNTPCDCSWSSMEFGTSFPCFDYKENRRYMQNLWWFGSKQDAWPNGEINSSGYPKVADAPNRTSWWSNWDSVPGADTQRSDSQSSTVYEMLKKLSSQSMVQIPLHNYRIRKQAIGTHSYTSFDMNGIHSGYTGCDHLYPYASQFTSNNSVAEVNPNLCPSGKYGYDPRCQMWYINAKRQHAEKKDPLYISPPHFFADGNSIGQSLVLPIEDENVYLGQVSVDFSIDPILRVMNQEETPLLSGGFRVVISTKKDNSSSDILVSPNFDIEETLKTGEYQTIVQYLLPYDLCDDNIDKGCQNIEAFTDIITEMKGGKSGATSFNRTAENGEIETIFWTFAPIEVNSFRQISNANLTRGVTKFNSSVFSIGFGIPFTGLHDSHESIQQNLNSSFFLSTIILCIILTILFSVVSFTCAQIIASIVIPFSRLLKFITLINEQSLMDDAGEICGASTDMTRVFCTLEHLRLIVQIANSALFAGDLKSAYETLQTALQLFKKLENQKAIGITLNNLGNTMLCIYKVMKVENRPESCGMLKEEVIRRGIDYFQGAIDQGEEALKKINDDEGWSTNYLIFMQQLSNRYFNRAIFLLTIKDDHPLPDNAESQAFHDLMTSKDMDREVVDNGDNLGFKGDREDYFDLLLFRIKGILNLLSMSYEDVWGIDELVEDAHKELVSALYEPQHDLFNRINPAGQKQRLDSVMIQLFIQRKDTASAAIVGSRMMIEDDLLMSDAALWAITGLLQYISAMEMDELSSEKLSDVKLRLLDYKSQISQFSEGFNTEPGKEQGSKRARFNDILMERF